MNPYLTRARFTFTSVLLGTLIITGHAGSLQVEVANPSDQNRADEVIELSAAQLAPLGETNIQNLHVLSASGTEVLCQAVDTDFDAYRRADQLIFLTNLKPSETQSFEIVAGKKQVYRLAQFRAHGRFVRERFDDFAWENDRIAHRMYGKGLETWAGEPLTSSTVDIWSKRTPEMVIDRWYMVDDYHADNGQGADFYSAGLSRGCGGSGVWLKDRLWVSKNFAESRVLANGPIRVMFELVYEPFNVDGVQVREVKRITLDAGGQLDRFQSFYTSSLPNIVSGIGLKKVSGQGKNGSPERGYLAAWEKVTKDQGMQGLGIVFDTKVCEGFAEDKLNNLVLLKTDLSGAVTYWAGFCWDKAEHLTTFEDWQNYLERFAAKLSKPVRVSVTTK
jgi:hypothetical protein